MAYVGYRYVLPVQNSNDWKRNGEVGVYSNWSLLSTTQLLQDVGDETLPDYPQYARGRHLSQVFNGEFTYKPMELAKFSHGGQDAPYLRNPYWEFQGVESGRMFPRGEELTAATSATATLGAIGTGERIYTVEAPLEFTITVDDYAPVTVTVSETVGTRPALLTAMNDQITGAEFTESGGNLVITSLSTGESSSLEISGVTDDLGTSGVQVLPFVRGESATYAPGFGHTPTEKAARDLSFSRHSNWFFYGVPSADATFTGSAALAWDDPELPSYARRSAPYIYKGVGEDHLENPGEALATKQAAAEGSTEYAHQQVNVWKGVVSAKAL